LAMHKHTAWAACLLVRGRDRQPYGEPLITARRAAAMGGRRWSKHDHEDRARRDVLYASAPLAPSLSWAAVACASGWSVVTADCDVMSHSLPVLHVLKLVVIDISVGLDVSRRLRSAPPDGDASGAMSA